MTLIVLAVATVAAYLAGGDGDQPFNSKRAFVAGLAVFLILSLVLTGNPLTILDQVTAPDGGVITEYPY